MKRVAVTVGRLSSIVVVLLAVSAVHANDWPAPRDTESRAWVAFQKAARLVGDREKWIPAQAMMTMEFFDRHGDSDGRLVARVDTQADDGELTVVTTELERPDGVIGRMMPDGGSAASANDEGGEQEGFPGDPFSPAVVNQVVVHTSSENQYRFGTLVDGIGLAWTDQDGTKYEGTLWVSDSDGAPVQLDVTGDSQMDGVRSLEVSTRYGSVGDVILPTESISSMDFRFALLIRVRMTMTVEFSDYFEFESGS